MSQFLRFDGFEIIFTLLTELIALYVQITMINILYPSFEGFFCASGVKRLAEPAFRLNLWQPNNENVFHPFLYVALCAKYSQNNTIY